MQVYEHINLYLKRRNMSKTEFYDKLVLLEPKLTNTGEVPTINSIYAYLNGRIGIDVELLPYIARVLDIPEQLLFTDTPSARLAYIRHLAETMTDEERLLLSKISEPKPMVLGMTAMSGMFHDTKRIAKIFDKKPYDTHSQTDSKIQRIYSLLPHAPDKYLTHIETQLLDYKGLTARFV